MRKIVFPFYFKHLEVPEGLALHLKTHQRTHFLPTLQTGGAGIYEKHVELLVMHHFKYVRMAAYQQIRSLC